MYQFKRLRFCGLSLFLTINLFAQSAFCQSGFGALGGIEISILTKFLEKHIEQAQELSKQEPDQAQRFAYDFDGTVFWPEGHPESMMIIYDDFSYSTYHWPFLEEGCPRESEERFNFLPLTCEQRPARADEFSTLETILLTPVGVVGLGVVVCIAPVGLIVSGIEDLFACEDEDGDY